MVKTKSQLVSSRKQTYDGTNGRKYITIHETANYDKGAGAQTHANLQTNGFSATWHWQVDDKQAIKSFPHTVRCWHAGDGKGKGNYESIGIEICVNQDGDFKQAVRNAAQLTKMIMHDEAITLANVVQHNHWSGKNCPTNLRNGNKGIDWSQFKSLVSGSTESYTPPKTQTKPAKTKNKTKGNKRIYNVQVLVNEWYGTKIVEDGINGPLTKKALIIALQTELNKQFNANLVVDGIWGPKTASACVTVRKGATGRITWILQARLYCLGYDPKGLDEIFGNGLFNAVKSFQGDKDIGVDGTPGKVTLARLFG